MANKKTTDSQRNNVLNDLDQRLDLSKGELKNQSQGTQIQETKNTASKQVTMSLEELQVLITNAANTAVSNAMLNQNQPNVNQPTNERLFADAIKEIAEQNKVLADMFAQQFRQNTQEQKQIQDSLMPQNKKIIEIKNVMDSLIGNANQSLEKAESSNKLSANVNGLHIDQMWVRAPRRGADNGIKYPLSIGKSYNGAAKIYTWRYPGDQVLVYGAHYQYVLDFFERYNLPNDNFQVSSQGYNSNGIPTQNNNSNSYNDQLVQHMRQDGLNIPQQK